MRSTAISTLFAALLLLSACNDTTGPDGTGVVGSDIRGHVLDSTRRPVADAAIVLEYLSYDASGLPKRTPTNLIQWEQLEAGWVTVWIASFCDTDSLRTLVSGGREPGIHAVAWDGLDDAGQFAPEGVYQVHVLHDGMEDRPVVMRFGIDYGGLPSSTDVVPLVVTDSWGRFTLSQDCLPFDFVLTLTNEAGDSLATYSIARRVRIWAFDSSTGFRAVSDTLEVDEETGVRVTLTPAP